MIERRHGVYVMSELSMAAVMAAAVAHWATRKAWQ